MSWKSSKSSTLRPLPETVTVGLIRKPHGVRGQVVVEVFSDVQGRFAVNAEVGLVLANGQRRRGRIAQVSLDGSVARVRFEGVADRDAAEQLRGALLEVDRDGVPPAPKGSYYFFELVGCRCVDGTQGELGRVERVLEDGGGLLLEVKGESRTLLVPFVQAFLRQIDVQAGRIDVDLPEGLVETCASES